jgi:LuxR family maltose regulon positive regulatory protein
MPIESAAAMASSKSSPGDPILTKIAPAARSGRQVARASQPAWLEAVASRRLTLVHAPAGYGKTSLLVQWHRLLAERGTRVAWLTLEEDESDVQRFAEYLVAAIAADLARESMPPRTALSALVNRLSRSDHDTVLILDDFHRAESDSVRTFVRSLIRLAPPTLHIVISSRDYPSLGQSALAAEEELFELGVEDLKFTADEAQRLLDATAELRLTPDEVARLVERTEGWPIALQMTALSLRKGCDRADLVTNFTGPAWELARYLSEQVLASLPADVASVVTATPIVDRINADLVNLLCDRTDGAAVLERLEQQNLFLLPLDAQRQSYRYHQLFAEILRDRLARRDPAEFRRLHRLAADWFVAHGMPMQAVNHAVLAADENFLAKVLDEAGGWRLIPEGRMDTLVAGLGHLSEATIGRLPRLQLARVYLLIKQGEMDAARTAYDAFHAAADRASLPADLWTEIDLVGEVLAEYENAPVKLEDLLAKESLIRSIPSDDHLMLSNVCESLGAKYYDCGWLERALEPTRRSGAHHRAMGSLYGELFTRFLEARVRLAQGRLDEAQATLQAADVDIQQAFGARSDLAAHCAVYQAELLFERDHVEKALALLAWALPHVEQSDGWFDLYASGFCTAIRAAFGRSLVEAEATIARMRALAARRHLRQLELVADVYQVEYLLHAGDVQAAQAEAAEVGLRDLAAAMREEVPVYRQSALAATVCLTRLHLAVGDHVAAFAELETTERWARQHGHGRLLIALSILASHAHQLAGEPRRAMIRFDEAVGMAMFQGFIGPFVDCWRFVPAGTSSDPRSAAPGKTDRFRENFLRRMRKALERYSAIARSPDLLSQPEVATLEHLNRGYTNKEIARLLKVSPNTVKYRLKSLYEKLGVNSRRDAVRYSREHNLVDPGPSEDTGS